jgi:hypothetical protein
VLAAFFLPLVVAADVLLVDVVPDVALRPELVTADVCATLPVLVAAFLPDVVAADACDMLPLPLYAGGPEETSFSEPYHLYPASAPTAVWVRVVAPTAPPAAISLVAHAREQSLPAEDCQ